MFSYEIGIVSDVTDRDLGREIAFLSLHVHEIIKRINNDKTQEPT